MAHRSTSSSDGESMMVRIRWAAATALVAVLACSGNETRDIVTPPVPVPSKAASIEVSAESLVVERGKQAQLTARFLDAAGNALVDPAPSFTSLNPSVATINAFGAINGIALGETKILVSGEKLSREVKLRVAATPAFLEVDPGDVEIRQFET